MAVKYTDLIDGNSGKKTIDGWELTRTAVVTGVTGTGHAKILNAAAELPDINAAHPSLSTCYLREIIPESVGSDTVKFRLIYSVPTPPRFQPQLDTIEVGGTLSQVQTNKDREGNIISVSYTYPSDYKLDENLAGKTVQTSSLVGKLAPEHTITYSNLLFYNPQGLSENFVGTVNNGPWILAPSAAAGTWLCTGIVGRSNDGGLSYATTYTFQYRADTWKAVVVFIDPNTGVPPDDLVVDTGIKNCEMYPITNFNLIFS
jgi:hypothetical protein